MDRLVCGDVGFGKTEIAIRAMAQAVANGYQAAMLVPTTILTEQHYVTLLKRFEHLPVRINHLSRFVDKSKQNEIIESANKGLVDVLIGTHKLFSQSIKFKNLGLIVIDEEQKFGVKDKERLKKLRANVNVLSLTATPIPRTLFMSLSGIRDISEINDPPRGRQKILTEVSKYDKEKVTEYISREIKRGGQVYYLHNRVETIGAKQNGLQKLFPRLKIEIAHGRMPEKKLADTMMKFADGRIDVLVCSTIVENGLDLPNANTLIVDDADRLGLSQLYQIRGRIGRSMKQSYALFMHNDKQITPNAFKRLKAIAENVELGSGFVIALSDLEIRGGGNILGKEQHGSMETVGLVLYSKLLKKAVQRLKTA
jgi:transcription-repair coupling factor (superfamily II helicase)